MMISVNNLVFNYAKDKKVLHHLSFNVNEGEIFGFLGPNGSGKSTTQKILTGLLSGFSGSVSVFNQDILTRTSTFYNDIGVLFEFSYLYNNMSGIANLKYFSSFYPKKQRKNIEQLLEKLELKKDYWKKPVSSYSKGMKQRVNMARALINSPKLLFLDEPISGLDPEAAILLRNLFIKEKENGTTIFITTHNMVDADILCDKVGFIANGNLVALDSPSNLKEKLGNNQIDIEYIENNIFQTQTIALDTLKLFLMDSNKIIKKIHTKEPTLEDVFIHYTGRSLSQC